MMQGWWTVSWVFVVGGFAVAQGADDKFKAVSALSLLEDAAKRAKEKLGGDGELARISMTGLKEDGTIDLTSKTTGMTVQYQFKKGDKGVIVNYIASPMAAEPMINVMEWDLADAKAFKAEDVKKFKDTKDLAAKAKEAGVKFGGMASVSYYIRDEESGKPEAIFSGDGGEGNAMFDAVTGEKLGM